MKYIYCFITLPLIFAMTSCRQHEKNHSILESQDSKLGKNAIKPDVSSGIGGLEPNNENLTEMTNQQDTSAAKSGDEIVHDRRGIVATSREVSAGDQFLKLLAEGKSDLPTKINAEQLTVVNVKDLISHAKPLEYSLPQRAVGDVAHAYARVLDVPIGKLANVQCVGVFEDADRYIFFYGLASDALRNFHYCYIVTKINGQVLDYVNQR